MPPKPNTDTDAVKIDRNIAARNYWRTRLHDFVPGSYFTDEVTSTSARNSYETYTIAASPDTTANLTAIAVSDKARHLVLLGALGIFINKYAAVNDLAVFSPAYADPGENRDQSVVPIRLNNFSGICFREFLLHLRENVVLDLAHADYPVHKIMNFEKDELIKQPITGMLLEEMVDSVAFDELLTDLLFSFSVQDELTVHIKYHTGKFSAETAPNLARLYLNLLERLITNREEDLASIPLLSKEEETRLLYDFNDTSFPCPANETLISLLEQQASVNPDAIALWYNNKTCTYQELDHLANRVGHYLQQKGIRKGDVVGLMLEREEMLLASILGILKSGAAYVPLDPDNPFERICSIIKDSHIKALITREKYANLLRHEMPGMIMDLDHDLPVIQTMPETYLQVEADPGALAYIIYTSGSTGIPNGVAISNKALINYIRWAAGQYTKGEIAGFALYSSIAFDLTVTSLFVPLITGNTITVFREKGPHNSMIEEVMQADRSEVVKLTPAHLRIIRDSDLLIDHDPKRLKRLIVGGEQLDTRLARDIYEKYKGRVEIYNEYGPTEATVGCMIHRFNPVEQYLSVPVGVPIHNTKIYILDASLRPVAPGVQGDLYISGDGLARDYIQRETLTKQKFIDNPWCKGEKMYRTGDLALRLPSGSMIYKGRIDEQVKIRGYRIEPGEIESLLKTYDAIEDAAVVVKERQSDKYLVAYYTSSQTIQLPQLQQFLNERLPAYMVPAYCVRLKNIPLTANGKVNRKDLPDPDEWTVNCYEAPETTEEKLLADIWTKVLGIQRVGATDNFFSLGGDSIKSIQVISRIRSAGYEITIDDIFSYKTLGTLAARIKTAAKKDLATGNPPDAHTAAGTIAPVAVQSHYPLSAAQSRLWVLSRFDEGNIVYNMRSAYVFEGNLDRAALEYAFTGLIARHESLRTVFRPDERGEIRQYILSPDQAGFQMKYFDMRHEQHWAEKLKQMVQSTISRPFDLAGGPLLKAELYQVDDHKWIFAYVMHHIISDGWSLGVLINELLLFYNAHISGREPLIKPLSVQYKDFTAWQQQQLSNDRLNNHREYWLNQLAGSLPVLALPVDKVRPSVKTFNGGTIEKTINPAISKGIKELGKEQGCTLFMSLMTVVNVLLHKYTRQEDIIIGTPVAGREHIELENQIGFYLNTLALRTRFSGQMSYTELLGHVKELTLGAFAHQVYPFDTLLGEIPLPGDESRSALFDVMVALQNTSILFANAPQRFEDLQVKRYEGAENLVSTFDLTFDFIEIGEEIVVNVEYNSDLFYRETASQIANQLEKLMELILQQPSTPICMLGSIGFVEKAHLSSLNNKKDLVNDLGF